MKEVCVNTAEGSVEMKDGGQLEAPREAVSPMSPRKWLISQLKSSFCCWRSGLGTGVSRFLGLLSQRTEKESHRFAKEAE